jgi:uncharacterized lipoprotein YddW (UPF0748 family)
VLANVRILERSRFKLAMVSKIGLTRIIATLAFIIPLSSQISPVLAAGEVFGVVKSQENTRNWDEITGRLQQIGLNYCVVDASSWQEEADLGNLDLLLLPNVEKLNGAQSMSLQKWMNRGGKAIVTGPTGELSTSEVRSQLHKLFGAYWSFALSSPSTLDPSPTIQVGSPKLTNTFLGGAILPEDGNSETLARWISDGKPAAVVATRNVTALGWRWGTDAVAPASFDVDWMEAVLTRYGVNTYGKARLSSSSGIPCNANPLPDRNSKPFLPQWQPLENKQSSLPQWQQEEEFPQQTRVNFTQPAILTPNEVDAMSRELSGLIGRFESTLLTADANSSKIELSTSKLVKELLNTHNKNNKSLVDSFSSASSFADKSDKSDKSATHKALNEAKQQLEKFQKLAQQGDYDGARKEWMEARRNLWQKYPTDRQLSQSEVRSMWLDRGTIVKARSEADLAKVFDRMADAGINTVFFETLNASYPIYPSHIAPEQNPLTKGWDPLASGVKLAHERGMELHAWMWMFAAANQNHNLKLNQPQDYLGPVLSVHPDWANLDNKGNIFEKSAARKAFFDPANPAVKRYLTLLLEEVATRYQVDGIQIDYIRYPFQNPNNNYTYGYGVASRQQFQSLTGVDPIELTPSHELWSQWNKFRIDQIDNFVADISQRLKQKRPDLTLSAAVFPIARHERLSKIQQNWEEWVKKEWIDLLVPMTYANNTEELAQKSQAILDRSQEGSTLFLPGIRLLNLPDFITMDQMQLLRNSSFGGYALFATENLQPSLENIFNRTQRSVKIADREPIPHRQPFQATAFRYQGLQREWNYLLANNLITMDDLDMKELAKQADELSEIFDRLAQKPSQEYLTSARSELSSFRKRFPFWMQEYNKTKPLQVQAWQNRLVTLDRLLSYGNRVILSRKL